MSKSKKENIMEKLGCTEAEALDIIAYDKKVDQAKETDTLEYDLPLEVRKEIKKKYLNVDTRKKPTVYQFKQKERKIDSTKEGIIAGLAEWLTEAGFEGVNVVNASRIIAFSNGIENFELTLGRKRAAKK